jgi:hypothetical protein
MGTIVEVDLRKDEKRWMDSVKYYMRVKEVSLEMTINRIIKLKKKTCCPIPTYWDKGTMMMMMMTSVTSKQHFI